MKLTEILSSSPGTYVWLYSRETSALKKPKDALRRIHTYLGYNNYAHRSATCTTTLMVNCRDHTTEPAIIITTTEKNS